jgi:Cu-Zn family superoxide dismutase
MNSAISVFQGPVVYGTVQFIQSGKFVDLIINLSGLKKNGLHGFHIHTFGDLSDGCNSACSHFNPYNKTHGCPGMKNRHVGDLGNLITDSEGNARYIFRDDVIKLSGKASIIGRMLIIHQDPDDCGQAQGPLRAESLKTGNAGKRIACAVVGIFSGKIK